MEKLFSTKLGPGAKKAGDCWCSWWVPEVGFEPRQRDFKRCPPPTCNCYSISPLCWLVTVVADEWWGVLETADIWSRFWICVSNCLAMNVAPRVQQVSDVDRKRRHQVTERDRVRNREAQTGNVEREREGGGKWLWCRLTGRHLSSPLHQPRPQAPDLIKCDLCP